METEEKINFIFKPRWLRDELKWFTNSDTKLKEHLNKQEYRLMDVEISSRVLNHWYEFGIIDDNRANSKGWKKFSVSEIIWIHIVLKLRRFGLNLEKIKRVKNCLDNYNTKTNISKCVLLDYFIGFVLHKKDPIKLLVFETGDAYISPQLEIDMSATADLIHDDYISIDLNKLVSKVTYKPDIKADYLNYSTSDIGKEVDRAFYFDNLKSLTITDNNGEEFLVTKEHIKNSKGEIKSLINKIGNYFEESTISIGSKKIHKLIEKKKIKR